LGNLAAKLGGHGSQFFSIEACQVRQVLRSEGLSIEHPWTHWSTTLIQTAMPLNEYRKKRDFKVTPEPSGSDTATKKKSSSRIYVVQKHRATQLHYDFRLEWRGSLLSWAIPKGPSLDPAIKRLAMQVEDHPVEYAKFEGVIPANEYGGGTVMIWDKGTWQPESPNVDEALAKGDLKFILHGKKLRGSWVLVRTHGYGSSRGRSSWLLIKHHDAFSSQADITSEKPYSVVSRRLLAGIARDNGGNIAQAATGDPQSPRKTLESSVATATRRRPVRRASKTSMKRAGR
jgi:bifunctional non-homologous end joining protein LigD